jgi:hypothetical protein
MKKYLLFITSFVFVFSFILISTPNKACAAQPGDAKEGSLCGGDFDTDPLPCYDVGCIPPPICEGTLQCIDGTCKNPAAMQKLACTCKNNTPTSNNEATGGNAITCPGLPEIYCNFSADACYNGGTEQVPSVKVNLKGNDNAYKDKIITGVSCNPKQEIATCACNPTPNKNGFDCSLESNPNIKGTATCSGGNACKPSTDGALMNEAANQRGELFDKHSVNMKGVKCVPEADEAFPTAPPPPSPPCAQWNAGKCDTFATAFGALETSPEGFVKSIFAVLLSLSGGIALLLIIKAGYQMMTSQGKPEQLQNARDQIIAAIVGLIFLIFSFVVLQVIGVDILKIPGFGG